MQYFQRKDWGWTQGSMFSLVCFAVMQVDLNASLDTTWANKPVQKFEIVLIHTKSGSFLTN